MLHTTKWRPDTCQCELEYEWDDEIPEAERVHVIKTVVACERHQSEKNDDDVYAKVQTENFGKNAVMTQIMEAHPELVVEKKDSDGNMSKQFKEGEAPKWEFDEEGKLVVEIKNLSKASKDAVRAMPFEGVAVEVQVK